MTETTPKSAPEKKNKKKGPIRFEAIIPVLIISVLTFLYFSWYFDRHLKQVSEYVGTQVNGAEVNIRDIRTSFLTGTFDLWGLQVTDPERPTHNSLEIGNIHFKFLWDALLRMKFVVEDASITNVQLIKPRKSPGHVLPPSPAKPSKMQQIQDEVLAQVKNKYGMNVLGDVVSLLEGTNYEDQIEQIRGTLKSEERAKAMVADVETKKNHWDNRIKELSDTTKLKSIEQKVNAASKEKNFVKQAAAVKDLMGLLRDVEKQYKDINTAAKSLQDEVKMVTEYPKELQQLVNDDVNALKDRFKIPKIDFKDMAMHLFAGDFASYIAKARKYQAVAKEYMPTKKEEKEEIVPPKRSEGRSYDFPITTGYPLFWLKRAAISSKGTADSYSGDVTGELTNVTTSPRQIKKPVVLDLQGNFPASQLMGVKALLTLDHTRDIAKQSALIQVNSFMAPAKMFSETDDIKFGFLKANGSSTITAELEENKLKMNWNAALNKPEFLVETKNKIAREVLNNVVNSIPVINIDGSATGSFTNLKINLRSNLGEELGQGFTREIGAKLTQAQSKLNKLVDEKVNAPKNALMGQINGLNQNFTRLEGVEKLFKQNQDKIEAEIAKLKSGGEKGGLEEKGKKLLKGIKL